MKVYVIKVNESFSKGAGMDELLTKIWKDKAVLWKTAIVFESAFCSALCALITQSIVLTVIYIAMTALIDIIAEIDVYLNWDNFINRSFRVKNSIKYAFFTGFAMCPVICGIFVGEICISGIEDIISAIFVNILPNILGALIVCSVIRHISRFGYEQFARVLIRSRRDFLSIVIRGFFWCCYLNAVNYRADDSWNFANCVNSVYLFVIMSCGAVALGTFLFRLMDKQPIHYTAKQVFPAQTLFVSALFLISCGVAPLFAGVGKHEPVLLCLNTCTAVVITVFLLKFVVYKTDENSREYPIGAFSLFCLIVIANCIYNFYRWDGTGDVASQVRSGILVFVIVLFSLLYLNKKQNTNAKNLQEKDRMERCG